MTIEAPPDTPSRHALIAWMAEDPEERTQSAIAKAMGVKQPSVAEWLSGKSRPKHHFREALHRLTKGRVHRDGWMTAEEQRRAASTKPFRRAAAG